MNRLCLGHCNTPGPKNPCDTWWEVGQGEWGGAAVRHMSYDLIETAMKKIIQLLKMMLNV